MKVTVFTIGIFALSGSTIAASSDIPKDYRGVWGDDAEQCKLLLEQGTDFAGATITADEVLQPEYFCKVSANAVEAQKFEGTFECSSPEAQEMQGISLTLNEGKLQIDGDSPLMLCK